MSEMNGGLKVGDYLESSWGYDQTNVDFYKVVALVGKTMVSIVPVKGKIVSTEAASSYVIPSDEVADYDAVLGFGNGEVEPVKKKAKDGRVTLRSGYYWAYKWDGKPAYETAAGWGR